MKKFLGIILILFIIAVVFSVAKDLLIKTSVEKGMEIVTGLRLNIQFFNLRILRTSVKIGGLKLFNPDGYRDRIMLNMPEIFVDYDLPAILKGVIHLEEVRIDMKEFVVVKNEKGEINLDALRVVKEQKGGEKAGAVEQKGEMPELRIDKLGLKIGKVIYKDYSKGGEPSVREYDINLDEKYQDVNDPAKLVSLIVVRALMNTTIGNFIDFDLKGMQGTISDTLGTAQKAMEQTTAAAGATLQQTSAVTKETVKATTETLKKTTEDLKETLKLPFGGSKEE